MEHYRLEWQSAQDYAGPLSHCLPLPEKERKEWEEKEGKKQLRVGKNKLGFFLFFIIYFRNVLYGNSKPFQMLSTAQPEV